MQPQYGQQPPQQQPIIMNIQQNAGPQGYAAPAPPAPDGGYPTQQAAPAAPAPIVIQQNKQGKSFGVICCILIVLALFVVIIASAVANSGPGFPVKDICELDGQTFDLIENIILTEPQVSNQEYESNKDCEVTITVPDKQISLEFEHFEVESSWGFSCIDWLKVEDDTFCGTSDPGLLETEATFDMYQEYSTDKQSLTFRWYTDNDTVDRGFRLILKHKDSGSKPDFFDNSQGFRAHLTTSKKHKEE